jgi:hypothetical protein
MPHRRFLLGSLAYPLSSNISDVARVDYGRYGRINSVSFLQSLPHVYKYRGCSYLLTTP